MDNPEWRKAYNFMLPQVTDFYTELEQDQDLFECYKKLQASMLKSEIPDRDSQRLRSLELAIQDFRLSGAELPRDQRARLADLIRALSKLGQQFSEQVLDAMNQTSLYVAQASGLSQACPKTWWRLRGKVPSKKAVKVGALQRTCPLTFL